MKYRKRFFTLLEVLISLGLTVVVLTTLTYFYRQVSDLNAKAEVLEKEGFKMRYVESRFSKIFPLATPPGKKNGDFFFFTVSDPGTIFAQSSPVSLIFTFDNGVDLAKDFSNIVLARIFLDEKKRLSMAMWPSPQKWKLGATIPMRLEVLLEDVDQLKLSFFVAPDRKWQLDDNAKTNSNKSQVPAPVVVTTNPSPEGSWIADWSHDYKQLPAMIKLEILRKGKTDYYVFPLSNSNRQPVYKQ